MAAHCPEGHATESTDYCDVCGTPMDTAAAAAGARETSSETAVAPAAPTGVTCPNCSVINPSEALFCEACGYDYTTGTMPRPAETSVLDLDSPPPGQQREQPDAAPPSDVAVPEQPAQPPAVVGHAGQADFDWVAEVWIDPDWYRVQQSPDPLPSPGLPDIFPLRGRSILIGRTSRSKNVHPEIDCEPDSGISRRQAQLTSDGSRWYIEDLDSANGTYVADAAGPLPEDPIPAGRRRELDADDRIYIGAWTRIVLRHATPEEIDAFG